MGKRVAAPKPETTTAYTGEKLRQLYEQVANWSFTDINLPNLRCSVARDILSIEDSIGMPQYMANRDVAPRLKKEHLKGSLTATGQLEVVIAQLPADTKLGAPLSWVRIDGNSHLYATEFGELERAPFQFVKAVKGLTDKQVQLEYITYVNKARAATPAEELQNARKIVGFQPVSSFCRSGWKECFKQAGYNEIDGMIEYKSELGYIDSLGIENKRGEGEGRLRSVGVKMAMLTTLREDRQVAEQFWKEFFKGSLRDSVHGLKATLKAPAVEHAVISAFRLCEKAFADYKAGK